MTCSGHGGRTGGHGDRSGRNRQGRGGRDSDGNIICVCCRKAEHTARECKENITAKSKLETTNTIISSARKGNKKKESNTILENEEWEEQDTN